MKKNGFSVSRKTTTAQKDLVDLYEKIVSFILNVSMIKAKSDVSPRDIIAMDETSVWFDCVYGTTVDAVGTEIIISIKTTGKFRNWVF